MKINIKTLLKLRGQNKFKDFIIDYLLEKENFFEIKQHINDVVSYGADTGCVNFLISKDDVVNLFDCFYKEILSYTTEISIENCFNKYGIYQHTKVACEEVYKDIAKVLKCENEKYLF